MGKIAEIADRMAELQKEVKANGQQMVQEEMQELFDKYPKLETIVLTGYVDYFNDGEPCTFSMREYLSTINGISVDKWAAMDYADEDTVNEIHPEIFGETGETRMEKTYEGWGANRKETGEREVKVRDWIPNPDYDPDFGTVVEDVTSLMFNTPSEVFETIFGSHFRATITRDGIMVEEYTDHD